MRRLDQEEFLKKFMSVSLDDIKYMAGFFDGEGCISISKAAEGNVCRLEVTLSNTDQNVVAWIGETFGGYVTTHNRESKRIEYRAWVWKLYADAASMFLLSVVKYLRVKREQALLAVRFQMNKGDFRSVGTPEHIQELHLLYHEKMKLLKRVSMHRLDGAPNENVAQLEEVEKRWASLKI